jgi:hypothetical protein
LVTPIDVAVVGKEIDMAAVGKQIDMAPVGKQRLSLPSAAYMSLFWRLQAQVKQTENLDVSNKGQHSCTG